MLVKVRLRFIIILCLRDRFSFHFHCRRHWVPVRESEVFRGDSIPTYPSHIRLFLAQRSSQASPLISYSLNVSETRNMSSSPSSLTMFLLALTSLCLVSVALCFGGYSSRYTFSPLWLLHFLSSFMHLSIYSQFLYFCQLII